MVKHLLCLALLFTAVQARAADREVRGKLVEIDLDDKAVLIEQENGKKSEYVIGLGSKVHDSRGISNFGFKDARLRPGIQVRIVLPEKGNTIRQLHIVPASGAGTPKPEPQNAAARRAAPPGQVKAGGFAPARSGDDAARDAAKAADRATKVPDDPKRDAKKSDDEKPHEAKGQLAHIARIDKEKRTIEVVFNDTKRKATYTLDKGVEFVGPHGGVSDEELDDDRFIVGNQIRLEMDEDGRNVVRIHLPYRKHAKGDK